jgi:hypothetical protein
MASRSAKDKRPYRRWFLGYREFEIDTTIPVREVLDVLNEHAEAKSRLFALKPKPFLGSVNSNEFALTFNKNRRPRVYGKVSQVEGGSILAIRVKENGEPLFAFFVCVVAWATLFALSDISSLIWGAPYYAGVFFGLRLLFYLLFRFDVACVIWRLRRMFE